MDDIRDAFARQGLRRAPDDRVFGGIATGLGRRLGLDPPAVGLATAPRTTTQLLSARSGSAVTPMPVRPDVEGLSRDYR